MDQAVTPPSPRRGDAHAAAPPEPRGQPRPVFDAIAAPPPPPEPQRKPERPQRAAPRPHRWPWIVALLAIAGIAIWWWTHRSTDQSAAATQPGGAATRPVPVVAVPARRGDLPIYLTGLGDVTPLNTVTVRSRVDGQVDLVAFTEGQVVKKDDLLAQIDPRPFQVQLEQAEGQLARDEALLKNAQADLERYLAAEDAVPRQQVDTQKALIRQYEASLK